MSLKRILRKYKYIIRDFFNKDALSVSWDRGYNFGDALNPILLNKLTNKKILWVNRVYYPKPYIMCIGSILQKATSDSLIWGSGFISSDSKCSEKPKKVYAVRGPKTRAKLLEQDIDCPEVYGDPALLLPKVYAPKIEKKYKLGIIPHYVDQENKILDQFSKEEGVIVIDIKMKDHYAFIDLLLSCEKIVSSSLHGVIVADAYNIPSVWAEFSKNVKGEGFKFFDYFLSVKRTDLGPLLINNESKIDDLYDAFYDYKIDIDLDLLIKSFPYDLELDA